MDKDKEINEVKELIKQQIVGSNKRYVHLAALITEAGLHTELLNISAFESIVFQINPDQVALSDNVSIDRLTLVYPPSYAFRVDVRVKGLYKVKYKAFSYPLPQSVEPFSVNYTGIIVNEEEGPTFKNEKVIIA